MKQYRIADTHFKVDEEEVAVMTFSWENDSAGRTAYWMNIFYREGQKNEIFLGNNREQAHTVYQCVVNDVFVNAEVLMK